MHRSYVTSYESTCFLRKNGVNREAVRFVKDFATVDNECGFLTIFVRERYRNIERRNFVVVVRIRYDSRFFRDFVGIACDTRRFAATNPGIHLTVPFFDTERFHIEFAANTLELRCASCVYFQCFQESIMVEYREYHLTTDPALATGEGTRFCGSKSVVLNS